MILAAGVFFGKTGEFNYHLVDWPRIPRILEEK
jgi:hypothetical protein